MLKNFQKSKGAISTILLILAVVIIVVIIIVFVVIKLNAIKSAGTVKTTTTTSTTTTAATGTTQAPPKPVTDVTVDTVEFTLISAQDLGSTMKSPKPVYIPDLTTTGRFIKVTIGAENVGKTDTKQGVWGVGSIVDSDGRVFIPADDKAYAYLPNPNLCGSILKPAFDATSCVRYYEVSKVSTGLKVEVNATPASSTKKKEAFIDLLLK